MLLALVPLLGLCRLLSLADCEKPTRRVDLSSSDRSSASVPFGEFIECDLDHGPVEGGEVAGISVWYLMCMMPPFESMFECECKRRL